MESGGQQNRGKIQGRVANLTNAGKGRPKGVPNKATASIKALAQQYAPEAIKELARLALKAESEQARVAAIKELFDRGYGKAKQEIEHSGAIETTSKEQRDAAVAAATRADK